MVQDPVATFDELHRKVVSLQQRILEIVYEPEAKKELRPFNPADVARWLGLDRQGLAQCISKLDLTQPAGSKLPNLSIEELHGLREYLDRVGKGSKFGTFGRRSQDEHAKILATMIFKGGTGKTTLSVHLAQYLCIRGYKVLLVDLDPQASATTLFGRQPATEVEDEQTFHGYVCGDSRFIETITPTYWPSLDLIPANLALATTDAEMAGRVLDSPAPAHPIYRYLYDGLSEVRDAYDVIVIDCRPDLGMTTLNALLAADGIIVPVGMSQLDVASMGEFFRFCAYILDALAPRITPKELLEFDFMKLVVSRFDPQQVGQEQCRAWFLAEMPEFVLEDAILQTAALGHAHAGWETLYEYRPDSSRLAAYQRGLSAIDKVCYGLECAIWNAWGRTDVPPVLGSEGELK